MDRKPFETNGGSVIGVSNPKPPSIDQTGDSSGLHYVDVEEPESLDGAQGTSSAAKPRRLFRGLLIFAVLLLVAVGFFLWIGGGSKKKINLAVRDRSPQAEQLSGQKTDDVTAQAIAEVRGAASASPTPSPVGMPSVGAATAQDTMPVTVPLGGTVTGVESPATPIPSGGSPGASAGSSEKASQRNTERSIRCAPAQKPVVPQSKQPSSPDLARSGAGALPPLSTTLETSVPVPPFGVMLPVRTLGAIFTLRPSLSRFALTRDLRGNGWAMRKGTILIGQQMGSQLDRAYVSLMGFIDPGSGKLVKLTGDALGADGAPGLRGKRKQLSSRWARILSRGASAAVTLGQAALSRGGGTVINLPGVVSPEIQGLSPNLVNNREFVEVSAGSPAFILVTDLPKEIRGVDPKPTTEGGASSLSDEELAKLLTGGVDPKPTATDGGGSSLGDEELAKLLTRGSSDAIRAALPRMTPQLRRIAEAVLRESSTSDVVEGSKQK